MVIKKMIDDVFEIVEELEHYDQQLNNNTSQQIDNNPHKILN